MKSGNECISCKSENQASGSKQEPKEEKIEIDEAVEVARENSSLHDTLAKPMSHNELAQVWELSFYLGFYDVLKNLGLTRTY